MNEATERSQILLWCRQTNLGNMQPVRITSGGNEGAITVGGPNGTVTLTQDDWSRVYRGILALEGAR